MRRRRRSPTNGSLMPPRVGENSRIQTADAPPCDVDDDLRRTEASCRLASEKNRESKPPTRLRATPVSLQTIRKSPLSTSFYEKFSRVSSSASKARSDASAKASTSSKLFENRFKISLHFVPLTPRQHLRRIANQSSAPYSDDVCGPPFDSPLKSSKSVVQKV